MYTSSLPDPFDNQNLKIFQVTTLEYVVWIKVKTRSTKLHLQKLVSQSSTKLDSLKSNYAFFYETLKYPPICKCKILQHII